MNIDRVKIAGVYCDFIAPEQLVKKCEKWLNGNLFKHIVTLNPEMVMLAEKNSDFHKALNSASLCVPDGAGMIWARWYLRSAYWALWLSLIYFPFYKVERVSGVDMVDMMAYICAKNKQGMYLLGGRRERTEIVARGLEAKYDGLKVNVSRQAAFDIKGPADVLDDIRASKPAVLLVAFGAPKQSLWIVNNQDLLPSVRIAVGVGGAFDILSEHNARVPLFLRRFNLEWAWRLYLEPGRLPRIKQAVWKFPLLVKAHKREKEQ